MLIHHDPDRYETVSTSHTCEFHKRYPGQSYAGCTCGCTLGQRQVSDDEYRRRRFERERREDDAILAKARAIRAKRRRRSASAIEAQRATTVQQGVVHESAVPERQTPDLSSTNPGADNGRS